MKYSFFIFLLTICPRTWSQNAVAQTVYSNALTEKHVNIPGTRAFMIPGKGFHLADNTTGFQKDGNTGIVIYDMDGGNFSSNARNVNRANFEANGFKVKDFRELTINGFPAKYVCIQPNDQITAYQLVLGDSTFSLTLMATHETLDSESEQEVKKSIFSIVYDKSFRFDPLKSAFFTMDVTGSRFKLSEVASNIYKYTIDGAKLDIDKEEQFIMLLAVPNDGTTSAEMLTIMMLRELESKGMEKMEILSRNQTKVNGYEAFEVVTTSELRGKKRQLYQLVLVHQNKSLVFQGYSDKDHETNLAGYSKLAKSIKIK